MKKILLILMPLFMYSGSFAQVKDYNGFFALSPQVNFPVKELHTYNKTGYGGQVLLGRRIGEHLKATVSLGGGLLQGKNYTDSLGYDDTYAALPFFRFRAGVQYRVAGGIYCSGQAGLAHTIQRGASAYGFNLAPAIGYEFGENTNFCLEIRYDISYVKLENANSMHTLDLSISFPLFGF